MTFAAMYRFAVFLDDGTKLTDVTGSAATQSYQSVYVQTDAAGKYVVQLQTNDGNNTVVASLNVWVVWDNIQLTSQGTPKMDTTLTVAEGVPSTFLDAGYESDHTIVPPNILTDADRPDMSGVNVTPVAGATHHHELTTNLTLADGVNSKWDPSQQYRIKLVIESTPTTFPHSSFPGKTILRPWTTRAIPLLGNDDIYTHQTAARTRMRTTASSTIRGHGRVRRRRGWRQRWRLTFEWRLQCIDFGRAEINGCGTGSRTRTPGGFISSSSEFPASGSAT